MTSPAACGSLPPVPADNSIYEWLDDWWDPTGSVAGIHAMNPPRVQYFFDVLQARFGRDLSGLRVLDVGCGGGLLTEELLRRGLHVTGADIVEGALRRATEHARSGGLMPLYVRARGERLPFSDATFSAVLSSDFLEHVGDLHDVVREAARVLAPGGLFLYDTINRTWLTLLFRVGILQEWRKLVPLRTHDWRQFVTPRELEAAMRAQGLRPMETRGLSPAQPIRFALHLLKHKKGRDRLPPFRIGKKVSGSYVGYATK
ncbi:MAG: bifunctional 2-polyprenyl-6-hydroxyphenol methylase/3-demethylubiquinol 3-O-methyltransferase UbiG [Vicinamibacteria bacterium]